MKTNGFFKWYKSKGERITYDCVTIVSCDSSDHITISYGMWVYSLLLDTLLPNYGIGAAFLNNLRGGYFPLAEFLTALDEASSYMTSVAKRWQLFKGADVAEFLSKLPVSKVVASELLLVRKVLCSFKDDQEFYKAWQLLVVLKKLDIDRPDVHDALMQEYLDAERAEPAIDMELLHRVCDTITPYLGVDFSTLVPNHGPGSVAIAGIRSQIDKYRNMARDRRIEYLLMKQGSSMRDYNPLILESESTRTSRYLLVPKSWKTLRGISAEPIELQYWQQAVREALTYHIDKTPWLRRRLNLHSQQTSRLRCYYGQVNNSLATIDLSKASDSVLLRHVREVFKEDKPLLQWLLATRSTHVDVGGQVIRTKKFAPMGSATCFVVESLIFLAIAETAIRDSASEGYATIFGDDCIVPWGAAELFKKYLSQLGFLPNEEKSYCDGLFREACGWDVYNGKVITPVKFRRLRPRVRHDRLELRAADLSHLISIADNFQRRGFHHVSRMILRDVFESTVKLGNKQVNGRQCVAFSDEFRVGLGPGDVDIESSMLFSQEPTNYHLPLRLNERLWRLENRYYVVKSRRIGEELDDDTRYRRWLIDHQRVQVSSTLDARPVSYRDAELYLSSTWVESE